MESFAIMIKPSHDVVVTVVVFSFWKFYLQLNNILQKLWLCFSHLTGSGYVSMEAAPLPLPFNGVAPL